MDNKLKKFKLEDGSVVDGGRIIIATSTNFCAVISLEGDTRLAPNSVQLSRDFIGRTDADVGDLLYLDSDMNWAVSKDGWEEIEGEAQAALVPALSGQDDSALAAREEAVAAREVAVGEAEGRLALRETALVEGETALVVKAEALAHSQDQFSKEYAAFTAQKQAFEAVAAEQKVPVDSNKATNKGIKVTGG